MRTILFACKRTVKSVSFMVMLLVCAAAIFAASLDGASGEYPPAGVYTADSGVQSQRVVEYLTENGFVRYDDPEEMRRLVANGRLDCAVILPEDLLERMKNGDMEGCTEFITGPLSFVPQLYQNHVSAVLLREYAPYIAAKALKNTEIPPEQVVREYEKRFENGYTFTFELVGMDGTAVDTGGERSLMMGAAALLIFALLMSAGVDGLDRGMILRLGLKRTLGRIVLPGVLVRAVFAAAAGSIALLAAGAGDLVPALGVYTLVLSALSVFLAAILPDERDRYIFLTVVLILSLALCPIYVDLTMFSPLMRTVRCALAPYWFYLTAEMPIVWLVIGVGAMAVACGAIMVRAGAVEKLKIK